MDDNFREPDERNIKTVAGFLASALELEDKITNSSYQDYLNRSAWPDRLEESAFRKIQGYLTTLITDTEQHTKDFISLQEKFNSDDREQA